MFSARHGKTQDSDFRITFSYLRSILKMIPCAFLIRSATGDTLIEPTACCCESAERVGIRRRHSPLISEKLASWDGTILLARKYGPDRLIELT